jgi:hypothetical protein
MLQRTVAGAREETRATSELRDLSRQLEGGLDVIEAAFERYRLLSAALRKRRWKSLLRLQPVLLEAAITQEPEVLEVLEAVERRAEREPDGAGLASALLRELDEARVALARDLDRRLPADPGALFVSRLEALRAVVLRPLPLPPGAGERRLLEGTAVLPPLRMSLLLLALCAGAAHFVGPLWATLLLAVLGASFPLRSGRYWLTTERLLWQARGDEPVQVSLGAIGERKLTSFGIERNLAVNRLTGSITLHRQGVLLRHVPRAGQLAALLSIRRRKEFQHAAATRDPHRAVAVIPVFRTTPENAFGVTDDRRAGLVVLRPGFVAFFPYAPAAPLLDAITESEGSASQQLGDSRDGVPVSMEQLVDQLLLLPEEDMDRLLRRAAGTGYRGALLWRPAEVRCAFKPIMFTLKLTQGAIALWANLSWTQRRAVERVISRWPGLAPSGSTTR